MSRIGNKPINIPQNVEMTISGKSVSVKGPLGEDRLEVLDGISVLRDGNTVLIKPDNDEKNTIALQGLFRSLINNMVVGTSEGFVKELEIVGVGYRATQQGENILFQLGYSHTITFEPPKGIVLEVLEPTKFKVKGASKQAVGQVAANIRGLRPPEPYKGKGIRYKNEIVRKKAGKTGK